MSSEIPAPRPSAWQITERALRLRCPRCAKGKLYDRPFRMAPRCEYCQLKFLREPGYYLGSIYLNYGMTSLTTVLFYLVGRFYFQIPAATLLWPLAIWCLLLPVLVFHHSRALWLALDCRFDPSVLDEPAGSESPGTGS